VCVWQGAVLRGDELIWAKSYFYFEPSPFSGSVRVHVSHPCIFILTVDLKFNDHKNCSSVIVFHFVEMSSSCVISAWAERLTRWQDDEGVLANLFILHTLHWTGWAGVKKPHLFDSKPKNWTGKQNCVTTWCTWLGSRSAMNESVAPPVHAVEALCELSWISTHPALVNS